MFSNSIRSQALRSPPDRLLIPFFCAQDAVGNLAHRLETAVPGERGGEASALKIFLDIKMKNLQLDQLENYVKNSMVFVLFLTRNYVPSLNCRRELLAAYRHRKPMVVICETSTAHGALMGEDLAHEVHDVFSAQRGGQFIDEPPVCPECRLPRADGFDAKGEVLKALRAQLTGDTALTRALPAPADWTPELEAGRITFSRDPKALKRGGEAEFRVAYRLRESGRTEVKAAAEVAADMEEASACGGGSGSAEPGSMEKQKQAEEMEEAVSWLEANPN